MRENRLPKILNGSYGLCGLLLVSYCVPLCSCAALSSTFVQNDVRRQELAGHHILRRHYQTVSETSRRIWFLGPNVIFEDNAGRYWVGNVLGLYTYTETNNEWRAVTQSQESISFVSGICQDLKGTIWLLYGPEPRIRYLNGARWDDASELLPPGSGRLAGIGIMFNGRAGELWLLSDSGLLSFDGYRWSTAIAISEKAESAYQKLRRPHGNDAVSEAREIIESLIKKEGSDQRGKDGDNQLRNRALDEINSGLQDHSGFVWLCAERGILRLDLKTREWKVYALPDKLVNASRVYEDRKSRLWFADDRGHVAVHYPQSNTWKTYSLDDPKPTLEKSQTVVEAIYQDRLGQMMFATPNGLVILSATETKWQVLTTENSSIPANAISTISEDRSGRIWIGTGAGLVVLEP